MRRRLLGLFLIVLLTSPFLFSEMDKVMIDWRSVSEDVVIDSTYAYLGIFDRVVLLPDSDNTDSSYGAFETIDYWLDFQAGVAYTHLYRITRGKAKDTAYPADTIVVRILTDCIAGKTLCRDTLATGTFADTGYVAHFLGQCDHWVMATESTGAFIWFEVAVRDSQTDSANHGVEHSYYFEFGAQKVD